MPLGFLRGHAPGPSHTGPPLPAFLSLPLTSPAILSSIYSTLTAREASRNQLAALSHPPPIAPYHNHPPPRPGGFVPVLSDFAVVAGTTQTNSGKNRYGDIVAYDRTRVLLPPPGGVGVGEYVNASLVREMEWGVAPPRWWVAAQGPTNATIHAFLSLLLCAPSSPAHPTPLPPISLIIQLTPLVENRREKCHPYFPAGVGETWVVDPSPDVARLGRSLWIRLEAKEEILGRRTSILRVGWVGDDLGRRVVHVEYLGWGDHGVPDSPSHLLAFMNHTLSLSPPTSPILLHCSAGVGRTGTFLTIASLLPFLRSLRPSPSSPRSPSSPSPSPPSTTQLGPYPHPEELRFVEERDWVGMTVDGLRDQRVLMVQTKRQLEWCFQALEVAWWEGF